MHSKVEIQQIFKKVQTTGYRDLSNIVEAMLWHGRYSCQKITNSSLLMMWPQIELAHLGSRGLYSQPKKDFHPSFIGFTIFCQPFIGDYSQGASQSASMVAQWLAQLPYSKKLLGLNPPYDLGLSLCTPAPNPSLKTCSQWGKVHWRLLGDEKVCGVLACLLVPKLDKELHNKIIDTV